MKNNYQFSAPLIAFLLVSVLLVPTSGQPNDLEVEYTIWVEELPGEVVSPGGASSFRFEYGYGYFDSMALFWGWTGPNDLRLMGEDLSTVKTLELPSEYFEVYGARWTSGFSIVVWGNNGTGPEDSLLVYTYPDYELNTTIMPRDKIPLTTIDCAMLFGGDVIMVVAGRPANGTSQIITLEVEPKVVHRVHNYHDNLTVQSLNDGGFSLMALDVGGGVTIINTTGWVYEQRLEVIQGPFSWSLSRPNQPWTFGGENGRLLMRDDSLLDQPFSLMMDPPPLQAACWVMKWHSDNIIIASPKAGGGSRIQLLNDFNGTFEVKDEIETEGTVTSMMSLYDQNGTFSVSFSNGVFRQYYVFENIDVHYDPPNPDEDQLPLWRRVLPIVVIVLVVASVVILWYIRGMPSKDQ